MVVSSDEGQSLIEFLLLVPLMVGISILLVRMNTAIQISLVNQKYSRAQVHFLTMNSPYYPRSDVRDVLVPLGVNRLTVGVSEDPIAENSAAAPKATEIFVARSPAAAKGADDQSKESKSRSKVKVRTTVTLCAFSHSMGNFRQGAARDFTQLLATGVAGSGGGGNHNFCGGPEDHR